MKQLILLLPLLFLLLSCSGESPKILEFSVSGIATDTVEPNRRIVTYRCIVSDEDEDCNQVHFWTTDDDLSLVYEFDSNGEEVDTFYLEIDFFVHPKDSMREIKSMIEVADKKSNKSTPSDTLITVLK